MGFEPESTSQHGEHHAMQNIISLYHAGHDIMQNMV
jgi:hypothetical protein